MSALTSLLQSIETISLTNRDKGTSFENLMVQYFLNEPKYAEIYTDGLCCTNIQKLNFFQVI